jgi:hypothetical protein
VDEGVLDIRDHRVSTKGRQDGEVVAISLEVRLEE